jgi:pimeloyl-ACP methyl ester carboxylesterase
VTDSTSRYQSEQKSVPVPGGKLSYEVAGEGPVVLCLPSLGDTRREYDRVVPVLVEQGYRVVTTDLRGMGQSQGHFKTHSVADLSNDIKAILDAEGVEQAFLLGCSISGASAGLLAVEHPERVYALVLFSPLMRTGSRFSVFLLSTVLRLPGIGSRVWTSYFKSLYPARPVEPEYLEHIRKAARQRGAMKSIADMSAAPRIDSQIASIRVPTLIYLGTKDPDFKDVRAEAEQLRREIPQADIRVLEGIGHYPQREDAEHVVPELVTWLQAQQG